MAYVVPHTTRSIFARLSGSSARILVVSLQVPPFAAIPRETVAVLRPVLPGLADETIAAIAAEVPGYARAMEGDFGRVVRAGVEIAFERFLDPEPDRAGGERARLAYVNLGRG